MLPLPCRAHHQPRRASGRPLRRPAASSSSAPPPSATPPRGCRAGPPAPPPARVPLASRLAAAAAAVVLSLAPPPAAAISENQLLFLEAWRAVDRAYVDKTFAGQPWFRVRESYVKGVRMDSREQTYGAIRKLLATLGDPYTRFLDPDAAAALAGANSGAVTGVGLELAPVARPGAAAGEGPELRVVAPVAGGPAYRAGLRPGDALTAVDGQPLAGRSVFEAATQLQGPEGSTVRLAWRTPSGEAREASLVRAPVALRPVTFGACDVPASSSASSSAAAGPPAARVTYVRVPGFNAATEAGLRAALASVAAAPAAAAAAPPPPPAVVLDLRSNGGGSFPAAVASARLLLPPGSPVVFLADSSGVLDAIDTGPSPPPPAAAAPLLPLGVPLAVLVDRGTASAAEVLAGALRDAPPSGAPPRPRAALFGPSRTFGKGVIQTTVPLADGSAVNVTARRYVTPAGADIDGVGLVPDGGPVPGLADGGGGGGGGGDPAGAGGGPPEGGAPAFCAALVAAGPPALRQLFPTLTTG